MFFRERIKKMKAPQTKSQYIEFITEELLETDDEILLHFIYSLLKKIKEKESKYFKIVD